MACKRYDVAMKGNPELIKRVRRIEGQARGIERMMDEGRDCAEIVTQIAALRAAVDRLGYQLIRTNLRECLNDVELPKAISRELDVSLAALSGMRT
jgi:DNA-binding FrmR family transcriptional regulator